MPEASPDPNQIPPTEVPLPAESVVNPDRAGTDPLDDLGSVDDPAALVGQVISERYHLIELLGKGGMGAVYRADHVHIRKSFALKVLHRELTHHAEAVRRFEREAIAAARIVHPNVATATDFGRLENGAFYLVLDYVQGKSLRQVLEVEHHLSDRRAMRIARQIASALAAAHAAGIVHRDLKPDNVMLVEANAEPDFVKVLDFGVAKLRTEDIAEEPAITRFGTVFGTPEYMSPEQALGQSVDARSDLYALGIMLYEMLVGKTPFADQQLVAILTRQMTEVPAPLPERVSPELRHLVMQLLEKQADVRPASAEQVLRLIDALMPQLKTSTADDPSIPHPMHAAASELSAIASGETLLARPASTDEALGRAATLPAPAPAGPFSNYVAGLRAWSKRRVTIAGRTIALGDWGILAAGLLGVLVLFAAISTHGDDKSRSTADLSASSGDVVEDPQAKQLKSWMDQARAGDTVALLRLEERPDTERGAAEWAALGAGRARAKQWGATVAAYDRAFATDAGFARDARVHSDLYLAALDPQASLAALDTASKYLGSVGADLIYAVIEANALGRAPKVDGRRARNLLESAEMASKVSSALHITLKVEKARGCIELKSLLSTIEADGDQRTQRATQRKLSQTRGCGFLGFGDCYSCVRGSKALARALDASKARPCPAFSEPAVDATTRGRAR